MSVKLLIEHHLEFLSLKGGCTGSFESTRVKTPHCWKSHVTAHFQSHLGCVEYNFVCASSFFHFKKKFKNLWSSIVLELSKVLTVSQFCF